MSQRGAFEVGVDLFDDGVPAVGLVGGDGVELLGGGRLVVTGFTSRDIPEIRTILLLLKGVNLCGSNLSQTARHDPAAA